MNELTIYGDIGESFWGDSVTATDVKAQLDKMAGDVTVRVNSPGGSVFDGFAIYNLLREHDGEINVRVDGIAASAASVIAMAGDTITMGNASMMMIHDPWTMVVGDAAEMTKTAETLEKIKGAIVAAYAAQATELNAEEIGEMMTAETWMTAAEAFDNGFATNISEGSATVTNMARPWINRAPTAEEITDDPVQQNAWRVALQRRALALKTK